MSNLEIEQENSFVLFVLWHANCFLFVGVSAVVADSLQRHTTRLLYRLLASKRIRDNKHV